MRYLCKQTDNFGLTLCKSHNSRKPVQPAAICSRIHLVQNVQVGCYAFHFDWKITIYSSGLPTSFRYHLALDFPLLFVIIISSLSLQQIMAQQHLSTVRVEQNRAEQLALHPIHHSVRPNYYADTTQFIAMLQMHPPKMWPWTHSYKLCVEPEAARITTSAWLDVSILVSR